MVAVVDTVAALIATAYFLTGGDLITAFAGFGVVSVASGAWMLWRVSTAPLEFVDDQPLTHRSQV